MLRSIWAHREAAVALAHHDVKRAYAGTSAGWRWALLTPLLPLAVVAAVSLLRLPISVGRAPYALGFIAAYVPWVLLSSAITGSAASILQYRHLIKRTPFPVEVVPMPAVVVHSATHLVLLALVAAGTWLSGYGGVRAWWSLPYFYACTIILSTGLGVALSALSVVLRDLQPAIFQLLNVWFWLTPIVWGPELLRPAARGALLWNPAAYLVAGYRHALMPAAFDAPGLAETAAFWVVTASIAAGAVFIFQRLRPHFWECL